MCVASLLTAALVPVVGHAQTSVSAPSDKPWVSTWGSAMSGASNDKFFSATSYNGNDVFVNQTVRLIVLGSVGGNQVRIRLSNEWGTVPLTVGAAHIALTDDAANTVPGTDRVLTFNGGSASITIPTGAPQLSDPVNLTVPARTRLTVSLYLPTGTTVTTGHPNMENHTYVSPVDSGDVTAAVTLPLDAATPTIMQWPLLTGVEVRAVGARSFVVVGSSVADGTLSTVDANHRWTDYLSQRFVRKGLPVGVVNATVIANPLMSDGNGPNVMARFNRDVFARPGIAYVLINDVIGVECQSPSMADQILGGLREYIVRAHSQGLKAYVGTVLPLGGATTYSAAFEAKRQVVNAFIRSGGGFDGYVDFDAALRDPSDPTRIAPIYDGGDHHHLTDAGYKLMADTVDLALFQ